MGIVTLDVHAQLCQLVAVTEHRAAQGSSTGVTRRGGEVIIELQVETRPEELRRVVGGIPGPKRVVFEEGPLSASSPRTRRSLTHHEYTLVKEITRVKMQLEALCRRHGIRCRGTGETRPADVRAVNCRSESEAFAGWGECSCCFFPS